jgi:hypothetical protein
MDSAQAVKKEHRYKQLKKNTGTHVLYDGLCFGKVIARFLLLQKSQCLRLQPHSLLPQQTLKLLLLRQDRRLLPGPPQRCHSAYSSLPSNYCSSSFLRHPSQLRLPQSARSATHPLPSATATLPPAALRLAARLCRGHSLCGDKYQPSLPVMGWVGHRRSCAIPCLWNELMNSVLKSALPARRPPASSDSADGRVPRGGRPAPLSPANHLRPVDSDSSQVAGSSSHPAPASVAATDGGLPNRRYDRGGGAVAGGPERRSDGGPDRGRRRPRAATRLPPRRTSPPHCAAPLGPGLTAGPAVPLGPGWARADPGRSDGLSGPGRAARSEGPGRASGPSRGRGGTGGRRGCPARAAGGTPRPGPAPTTARPTAAARPGPPGRPRSS